MASGYVFLMIIMIWTIPMFFRETVGSDISLSLNMCSDNSTCDVSEFCKDGKCVNACSNKSCGLNEGCQVFHHKSSCECSPNFMRNYKGECRNVKTCFYNSACDDSESCKNGVCVNACYKKKCRLNEGCQVFNHKSSCECLPDFMRNDEEKCKKVKMCTHNEDCNSSELCANGLCVNGCVEKCAWNEICQGKNRTFSCECLPYYNRNIENKCKPLCIGNRICEEYEKCQYGICEPVVIYPNRCGLNAASIPRRHKQICVCLRGFGGDPYNHCLKRCKIDDDCEDSDICRENLCTNACSPAVNKCTYTQKCEVKNHTVNCIDGTNEYKSCETTSDCDEKSYCTDSVCIPLCGPLSCSDNQKCTELTFNSTTIVLRGNKCSCDSYSTFVDGSWKCYKPCQVSDSLCEENEHCNDLNQCAPGRHL